MYTRYMDNINATLRMVVTRNGEIYYDIIYIYDIDTHIKTL